MARLTFTIEAPEIVLDLLRLALIQSDRTLVMPDSIFPGFEVDVKAVGAVLNLTTIKEN